MLKKNDTLKHVMEPVTLDNDYTLINLFNYKVKLIVWSTRSSSRTSTKATQRNSVAKKKPQNNRQTKAELNERTEG